MMKFLLLESKSRRLKQSILKCADNEDAVFRTMQRAVDGNFEDCTAYFPGLPDYVDAWCNDECLLRPELPPILTYPLSDNPIPIGLLKGNILFTGYNDDGETLGLTDDQIKGIKTALSSMPIKVIQMYTEIYPTYYRQ